MLGYESVDWSAPVEWDHPLNQGLAGWYLTAPQFQAGVTFHNLCGLNHGTLTNMDPATDWVSAGDRRGGWGGLAFDGTNDAVVTDAPVITAVPATISCYVKRLHTPSSSRIIVNANSPTTANRYYYGMRIGYSTSGQATGGVGAIGVTASSRRSDVGSVLPLNEWHHVSYVVGSVTDRTLYRDGLNDPVTTSGTSATITFTSDPTAFAWWDTNLNRFSKIQLDDVRFHTRKLSADEQLEYYELSQLGWPGLLRRIPRRAIFLPSAAPGGANIPAMMRNYRNRRMAA